MCLAHFSLGGRLESFTTFFRLLAGSEESAFSMCRECFLNHAVMSPWSSMKVEISIRFS